MDGKQPGDPEAAEAIIAAIESTRRRCGSSSANTQTTKCAENLRRPKQNSLPIGLSADYAAHHETIHSPYHRRDRLYRRAVGAAALLDAGYRVRCLVRDATRLQGRAWRDGVETIEGDVLRPESLADAMRDAAVAYYLVHSLGAGADFPNAMCRPRATLLPLRKAKG